MEPGESRLEALQRELREEVGLEIPSLGPEVWTKTALFPMEEWDGQVDHVHRFRTERFEPKPRLDRAEFAAEHIHDIRWWSPSLLQDRRVTFAPRSMPSLLDKLRRDGVPKTPLALTGF